MTMIHRMLALAAMLFALVPMPADAQDALQPQLSVLQAVTLALDEAPEMTAAQARVESRRHLIDAGARRPNPTLDFSSEGVVGTGDHNLLNEAEAAIGIMQPLERGGDLVARRTFAERDRDVAVVTAELRRRDLIQSVELAYLDVQTAIARARVAEERVVALAELAEVVDRRVRAARDPVMTRDRIEARFAEARIEADLAQRRVVSDTMALASYWGGTSDFTVDADAFYEVPVITSQTEAGDTPELAVLRALRARSDAEIGMETARAVPDANVGLEIRHYQSSNDVALGVRFSIPLQVWNSNRSNIASARAETAAIDADFTARQRQTQRDIQRLQLHRQGAAAELGSLDSAVLPRLQSSLEQARTGFSRGNFSFLEIHDVQRALMDAQLRRVDAIQSVHQSDIQLRRLGELDQIVPQGPGAR